MARSVGFDFTATDKASATAAKLGAELDALGRKIEETGGTVDVDVDIDTAKYDAKMARLQAKKLKVEADIAAASRDLQVLQAEAREATGDRKVKIEADIGVAEAKLRALHSSLNALDRERTTIRPNVDSGSAMAKLALLRTQLAGLNAANRPINIVVGIGGALTAIGVLRSAIGSLGPGLGLFGLSAVSAGGVAAGALFGVKDAVTALGETDNSVSSKMKSNANSVASAVHNVEQAQRALRNAHEAVSEAQLRVADTARGIEDAQRGVKDALRGVEDAQRTLSDANRDALKAEEDLNDARRTAAERLDDLKRREEDMQESRASAAISVLEAQERLNAVMVDPRATDVERARAALTLASAKRRVETLAEDEKRLKAERADAAAKGVEGSDEVQAALDRQQDAQRRVADAQRGIEDANRRVEDAQRKVTDAARDHERALKGVRDAQEGVSDAAWNLAQAQRAVREASQAAGSEGSAAMNKLQDAMKGLTPEAQNFAKYIRSLIDGPLQRLRETAQRSFLPGLQRGIQGAGAAINQDQLNADVGNIGTNLGSAMESLGPSIGAASQQLVRLASLVSNTAFKDFAGVIKSILDRFTEWAKSQDAESVADKLNKVKDAFGKVKDVVQTAFGVFDKLKENIGTFGAITGALLALRVGMAVFGAVSALVASPVLAVIAVLAALGAGLVILYQKNETFRKAVNETWDKIKGWVSDTWRVLKPKFDEIKKIVMEDLVPAFMELVEAVRPFVETMIKSVGPVVTKIFGGILDVVKGALKILTGIIKVATGIIKGDWDKIWEGIKQIFSGVWDAMKGILTIAWNVIKTSIKNSLVVIKTIWNTGWNLLKSALNGIWEDIKTLLKKGWDWISSKVFDPIKAGVKKVGDAFGTAKDAIGKAWDQIKDKAKKPIDFVVNTVFWNMAKKFDSLAEKFGIPKLNFQKIKFASGGPIIGPGTGTSDQVPILASNGEWVIREAAARKLGPSTMAQINNADKLDISGDIGAALVRRRFASGGEVDFGNLGAVRGWIPSVDPLPYVWGGVGPKGYDCSGLVGEVWARLTGHPSYRRYMTTNTILDSPGSLGLARGPGLFSIGVSRTHTAGNLAGYGFEAASSRSGIKVGGDAKSVGSFPNVFHLATLGTAGADLGGGDGGFSWNPLDWAKRGAKAAIDKLSGPWFDKLRQMGVVGEMAIGASKKLLGGVFDQGGVLPPGLSLAYNGTGQPEPVLTARQWNDVAVSPRARSGGDTIIQVTVPNSIIGSDQQVAKTITTAVQSAVNNGTIRFRGK